MKDFLRAHRGLTWALGIGALALGAFVVIWFQPQKLFIEETVSEPAPVAGSPGADMEPVMMEEPELLADGRFGSLEHPTSGTAQLLRLADGQRFLRFEDLDTSNGPDLRVYLSEIPAGDDWYAYGERFVDLGALKGNRGDQNYAIPEDVDVDRFKSAVIWCRRFTVGFGVAPLGFD